MSKSIVIAAAASALLFAAPAFAQSKPHNPAFNGPHGSASDLTDRPSSDPTSARRHPAFNGPHGSASDLTDRPPSDPTAAQTAPCRRPGFEGPHGSATNLRDAPSGDPTAAGGATPSRGLTKVGAGTLALGTANAANSCR